MATDIEVVGIKMYISGTKQQQQKTPTHTSSLEEREVHKVEKASLEGTGDWGRILVMRTRKFTQQTSPSKHCFGAEWPEL